RAGRARHPPPGARLVLHHIGQPRAAEAGDETADGDLHLVVVAVRYAESDQDTAILDLRAAISGLDHRVPVADERHVSYPRQGGRDLVLGVRRDGLCSLMLTGGVSCVGKSLVEHINRPKRVPGERILGRRAEVPTQYLYVDGRLPGSSWPVSGRGFS